MAKEKPVLDEQRLATIAASSLSNIKKNRKALEDLRDKYTGLEVDGITDKETLKLVKAGVSETRTARTDIEKVRQSEKAYILRAGEMLDEEADTLTKIVTPVEDALKKEVERIAGLQEAHNRKLAEEAENRKQARIALLFENGLTFKDNRYSIGDINITPIEVTEYSESQFEGFIAMAQVEYEAIQLAEAEKEQERQRENERLRIAQEEASQREEQEREQRLAQQRENEALIKERIATRIDGLGTLGFEHNPVLGRYEDTYGYVVTEVSIATASRDNWNEELKEHQLFVDQAKSEERRKAEEEAAKRTVEKGYIAPMVNEPNAISKFNQKVSDRIEQLSNMGFHYIGEEDCYTKLGVFVPILDIKTHDQEKWDKMIDGIVKHLQDTTPNSIIDGVLAEQAENQAAYLETRPYHCTLVFNTAQPFMDTKVGRSVLRLYVEEFLDEANDGLDPDQIVESGNVEGRSDLLFLVFRK